MKPLELKVYEKGQVVLPLSLREKLHLKKGSRVRAFEYGGVVYLLPPKKGASVNRLTGLLPSKPSLAKELLKARKRDFS